MKQQLAIIKEVRSWIGTQYHHQGRLKKTKVTNGGVDCIGLVIGIAKELSLKSKTVKLLQEFDETDYLPYPRPGALQNFLDNHLIPIDKEKIEPADVLLFRLFKYPQHVGIATNCFDNKIGMIHCNSSTGKVVEHLLSPSWLKMLVSGHRVF